MMKASKIGIMIILVSILVTAVPVSTAMFNGQSEDVRAERIVELADKAGQKVDDLIIAVYLNETVLEMIDDATLLDELEGNVTLYDEGAANVTAAYAALEVEDYEGAVANATQALEIFRDVFRSINYILCNSDVQECETTDGEGLLVAMQRALERIEKLRALLSEDDTEALEMLDNATVYLDVDTARLWLLDGRVSETAYNLTQANHLISDVHRYLKTQAVQGNQNRMRNYLRVMEGVRGRIRERLELAETEGINVNDVLNSYGYSSSTEFEEAFQNMCENAQASMAELKNTLTEMKQFGKTLREMDNDLAQEIRQHGNSQGQGQGNGNGNGKN